MTIRKFFDKRTIIGFCLILAYIISVFLEWMDSETSTDVLFGWIFSIDTIWFVGVGLYFIIKNAKVSKIILFVSLLCMAIDFGKVAISSTEQALNNACRFLEDIKYSLKYAMRDSFVFISVEYICLTLISVVWGISVFKKSSFFTFSVIITAIWFLTDPIYLLYKYGEYGKFFVYDVQDIIIFVVALIDIYSFKKIELKKGIGTKEQLEYIKAEFEKGSLSKDEYDNLRADILSNV